MSLIDSNTRVDARDFIRVLKQELVEAEDRTNNKIIHGCKGQYYLEEQLRGNVAAYRSISNGLDSLLAKYIKDIEGDRK